MPRERCLSSALSLGSWACLGSLSAVVCFVSLINQVIYQVSDGVFISRLHPQSCGGTAAWAKRRETLLREMGQTLQESIPCPRPPQGPVPLLHSRAWLSPRRSWGGAAVPGGHKAQHPRSGARGQAARPCRGWHHRSTSPRAGADRTGATLSIQPGKQNCFL